MCIYVIYISLSSKSSITNQTLCTKKLMTSWHWGTWSYIWAAFWQQTQMRRVVETYFPNVPQPVPQQPVSFIAAFKPLLLLYFLSSLPSSFFAQILPIFQGPDWILPTQWSLLTVANVHNYLSYLLWYFPSLFPFAPNHGWYLICICILPSQRKFSMHSLERTFLQLFVE